MSSITVSSTVRGAAKNAIEIDLLLTETVQQRKLCGCLARLRPIGINCWPTWHRIDAMWRGLSGRYTATMTVMVCLDLCPWSLQSKAYRVYSGQPLRLAPNRPCMSLVFKR